MTSSTKQRLLFTKKAGVAKALNAIPGKYKYPAVALAGAVGYKKGGDYVQDFKDGRNSRIARIQQAREMSKRADSLFGREDGVFPLASESGAVSWRQSFLDGLYSNREKMGKMSAEQLKGLFPEGHSVGSKHGYRQRSMTSGKDAGSALHKAFKV